MPVTQSAWSPPATVSRADIIAAAREIDALPDIPYAETEDIIRIQEVGMEWDIGVRLYQPLDDTKIPRGPDGRRIGIFMLHGGQDDWRQLEPISHFLVSKFGAKVMVGTFPGRLYLQDPSRDWPGDTVHPDGSVRTPIWLKDEFIHRDEYEVVRDASLYWRYGTAIHARAKPGTNFYYRLAGWPTAMETGFVAANAKHFPEGEYSVYGQGHSTGGPQVTMLSQRIPNFAGALAAEHSAYGFITPLKSKWRRESDAGSLFDKADKNEPERQDRFNELVIRTWRDRARYAGPEALAKEGPTALMRLPALMEEVFDSWARNSGRPRFKCEYIITHDIQPALREAAEVTAARMGLDAAGTKALVERYCNYGRPLEGPGVKPVPPFLFGVALHSRDHSLEGYQHVTLPCFAAFNPPAKATVTQFQAGVHLLWQPEEDLPFGILPAVVKSWFEAINNGFFLPDPNATQ
jgi:hypothetical protein